MSGDRVAFDIEMEDLPTRYMREVYAYWLECRGEAVAAHAKAIDPLKLPISALPSIVVYDVEHHPLRFRVRLAGTAVVEEVGADDTGRFIEDEPGMHEQFARFRACVEERRPYMAVARVTWNSRDFKQYTVLTLPFVDDSERVARLMFVFAFT